MRGGLILCFLLWLAMVLGCASDSNKRVNDSTAKSEPPIEITAEALYQAYSANEVKADAQYKGRTLVVSGKIGDVTKDGDDAANVSLPVAASFGLVGVSCKFSREHFDELASLKKDQSITMKGIGDGKLGSVWLRDCVILSK